MTNQDTATSNPRTESRWAAVADIRDMALLPQVPADDSPDGVCIGSIIQNNSGLRPGETSAQFLFHSGPEHVLAFSPTHDAAGPGLIVPTLLSWRGSAVVYDPDGSAWDSTAGCRASSLNQRVFLFDPANPDTESVSAYNPLSVVRLHTPFGVGDVQNIAAILIDPDGKGLRDYWDRACQSFMSAVILHCCYAAERELDRPAQLSDIANFFSADRGSAVDQLCRMRDYAHLGVRPHPMVEAEAVSMLNKEEREQTSIISTAISYLTLYRDPAIAGNTARSDWCIADLMHNDRPATVYIVVRPGDASRLRPLIRLVATQIVRNLTNEMEFRDGRSVAHYKHRLLLIFNEFGALRKLPIIEESLAYMAGYGIKTLIVADDAEQLESIYGRSETVFSNCHVRVYAPPRKPSMAHVMAKAINGQAMTDNLVSAEDCLQMRDTRKDADGGIVQPGEQVVTVPGCAPIRATQAWYYQNPVLRERAQLPPPDAAPSRQANTVDQATADRQGALAG